MDNSNLFESLLPSTKSHKHEANKSDIEDQPKNLPWLMLPCDKNRSSCKSFFNVSNNQVLHLELPEVVNKRICGSSHGWLIMVSETSSKISLLNPLTKKTINLPPVTTPPVGGNSNGFSFCSCFDTWLFRPVGEKAIIHKIVLSANPSSSPYDYAAMAIYGKFKRLAVYKSGDKTWTLIQNSRFYYEDVIFYNGVFFAVDDSGGIVVCDIGQKTVSVREVTPPWDYKDSKKYLVSSYRKLLLVNRYIQKDFYGIYRTVKFDVFELDSVSQPKEWFKVERLGSNHVLFLGQNHSVCLPNSSSQCKGNCIYFTDDYFDSLNKERVVDGGDDLNKESLVDGY